MNGRSLEQRIKRVEATVAGNRTALRLESGETVYLERAADVLTVFDLIRAQYAENETGERVDVDDLDRVKMFAQSVPKPNDGSIGHLVKQMSQEYLQERDSQNG